MPAYQHLPVLPRKTSKHKLLFQEQLIFNTTSDNHLPDLSLYGISENNLKDDPILVSPQLQTAHTLHQLPTCIQQCNQPFLPNQVKQTIYINSFKKNWTKDNPKFLTNLQKMNPSTNNTHISTLHIIFHNAILL